MFTKKANYFWALMFIALIALGAKVSDDFLRIGDPASVTNKEIRAGNGILRWNAGAGRWDFSNDAGTSFKNIGSGSGGGGGRNVLVDSNADFESADPPSAWVNTGGGTFSAETTNPLFDGQSGLWDAAASPDTLASPAIAITDGFEGQKCQVVFFYRYPTGSNGDIQVVIEKGVGDELLRRDLPVSPAGITVEYVDDFDCPLNATTDTLKFILEATTNAEAITIDDVFLGTGRVINQNDSAELIADGYFTTSTNCQWDNNSASYADFGADSDCPGPTLNFSSRDVSTADVNLPHVTVNNLEAGTYEVMFGINARPNTVGDSFVIRISDGTTNVSGTCGLDSNSPNADFNQHLICRGVFTYTESGNRTFRPRAQRTVGASFLRIFNDSGDLRTWFKIVKYPSTSRQVLPIDQIASSELRFRHFSDCDWNINYVGPLALPTGDSTCTTSVDYAAGSFSNVASVVDGTGEQPAITWDSTKGGRAFACATVQVSMSANVDRNNVMQLYNATDGSDIQLAEVRTAGTNEKNLKTLCGTTPYVAGSNRIEVRALSADATPWFMAQNGGSNIITWTVFSITENLPTPQFAELTTEVDTVKERRIESPSAEQRIVRLGAACNVGSTLTDEMNVAASITNISAGACTITWEPNVFSGSFIRCWAQRTIGFGAAAELAVTVANPTNVTIDCELAAGGACSGISYHLMCMGDKGTALP